ncbi:MAG: hypothetical protein JWM56_373 [Candidatus Peribacteria bacterium]|nr:hypothetical protein [Candidatus Peribacteria bacterium]
MRNIKADPFSGTGREDANISPFEDMKGRSATAEMEFDAPKTPDIAPKMPDVMASLRKMGEAFKGMIADSFKGHDTSATPLEKLEGAYPVTSDAKIM